MSSKYYGSRGSGAPAWYLQRVSGVALFVVAIGHYILMHYHLDSGHTYDAVLARMQNPLYKALQISFVVLGLYHGLSGTWNIFRDYRMPGLVELEYSRTSLSRRYYIRQPGNRNDFIILIHSTDFRRAQQRTAIGVGSWKNLPKVYFWNLSFFIGVFNGSYV